MNIIHFTGNVGRDAEHRSTGSGDVCNFSVAVKQGYGSDAPTEWYRVEVWGKRAAGLTPHITKGLKVAVAGEFIIDQYEGKPQYRVKAGEVEFLSQGGSSTRRTEAMAHDEGPVPF
jgi:single-strand DNA-binding protein